VSRSLSRQPTATQAPADHDLQTGAQQGRDVSNEAALAQVGQGGPARDRNLPFRFKPDGLRVIKPPELCRSVQNTLHHQGLVDNKDGVDFSDSETLWVVVDALTRHGVSATQITSWVTDIFFDHGDSSRARDYVQSVVLTAGEVRVSFRSPEGHHINPGPIIPLIATAPQAYAGRDTSARGAQVAAYQQTGRTNRGGTWLEREAEAVKAGFLMTPSGKAFQRMDPATRDSDPAFRQGLRAYEEDIAVDYLVKARAHVKQILGPVNGRSAQDLLQAALQAAMQYTNTYVHAKAHTEVEIQDEAVAQAVMADLGFQANVDTDDVAASRIVAGS